MSKFNVVLFVIFFTIALLVGACGLAETESVQIGAGMSENTCPGMGESFSYAGESDSVCYYYDMTNPEMQMIEIVK